MAEQRLVDATNLKVMFEHEYRHNKQFNHNSVCKAWQGAIQLLYDQPTIDPETIPVVRQLREENARLRNEVMRIRKFENPPMHTIIFEMKYADFMDAGRVEELAAEVLIGLMAKDAASRHPVKEVTL